MTIRTFSVTAPTVNKRPKSNGAPKRRPDGKLAAATPRPAWLNANQRYVRAQQAKLTALWRDRARDHALALDWGPLDGQQLCLGTLAMPSKRVYDPANYHPTAKAVIDGLVEAGWLPDDNQDHLIGPFLLPAPTAPRPGLLTLHFVPADDRERFTRLFYDLLG